MADSVFQILPTPAGTVKPTIHFRLAPSHVAYANTLRRLVMTSVQSVGFRSELDDETHTSDIQVLANSTPMTNEMLAHRVGLLPIHVPNPQEWNAEDYLFEIEEENDSERPKDITSSNFRVSVKRGGEFVYDPSLTNQFFPPNPITRSTCLIATLKGRMPGHSAEKIHIKAKATVGTGRENARFIPTAQASYVYTRDTNQKAQESAFEDWLRRQKKVELSSLAATPEKKDAYLAEYKTMAIDRCFVKDPGTGEPNSFDFTIESVGIISPEDIVLRACEEGTRLCQRFGREQLPEETTVQVADGRLIGYDFILPNQDHTLGHLLQAWMDQNLVGKGEVTFAGYDVTHPLKDEIVIRIGILDRQEETARLAFRKAATACATMFQQWKAEWATKTGSTRVATAGPAPTATSQQPRRVPPTLKKKVARPGES